MARSRRAREYAWRAMRIPVEHFATVWGDGFKTEGRVANLSAAGFVIQAPLPIGEIVRAEIPPLGNAAAQVRWSLGARSGLMFIEQDHGLATGSAVADLG